MANAAFVASASGAPFLYHWQTKGGDPATATLKPITVLVKFSILVGWQVMKGPPDKVSTNQPEPLYSPPVQRPRARIVALVGSESPVCCQPPAMRVPAPRLIQSM